MIPGTSNCGELGNRKAMDAIFDPSLYSSCQEAIVCLFKRIFLIFYALPTQLPFQPSDVPPGTVQQCRWWSQDKDRSCRLRAFLHRTHHQPGDISQPYQRLWLQLFNQNPQDLPWVSRQDLQPTPIRSRHIHLAWTPDSIRPEDISSVVHLSMKWWHLRGFSCHAPLTCWPRR